MPTIHSDRVLVNGCLGVGRARGTEGRIYGDTRKLLRELDIFIILFAVLVSQVCTEDKTNQTVHCRAVQFTVCQLPPPSPPPNGV